RCSDMHVYHDQLEVRTHGKGLYEITDGVQSKVDRRGIHSGTITIFVQHTSCSIVIMENADHTARRDLEDFLSAWCPKMPTTSRTIRKAATTCHHISAWC